MKKSLLTLSAIVATLFTAQAALAQTTRAEVKADAASAVKSGAVAKGEGPAAATNAKPKMTKDRAEVKKEAAAAEKAGTIEKGPSPDAGKGAVSTKDRADVKKEAAAAVKAGDVGKGPDVKK